MKARFILLTFLLLFARGCDFYSTSLWFFQRNGIKNERNPLTYFFGVGWTGLIITNVLIVGTVILLLYYFYFRYRRQTKFIQEPQNYRQLASMQYFDKPDMFFKGFYKMPKNIKPLLAHMGYVLTIGLIIASMLATVHNFGQFYNLAFYNQFRQMVGRPLFVIYGIVILTSALVYRELLKSEFKEYMNGR